MQKFRGRAKTRQPFSDVSVLKFTTFGLHVGEYP